MSAEQTLLDACKLAKTRFLDFISAGVFHQSGDAKNQGVKDLLRTLDHAIARATVAN